VKFLNYRFLIFAITFIVGVVLSYPSISNSDSGKRISLGLDLQGGLHMLLGVNVDEAVVNKYKTIASSIKYFSNDEEILIEELKSSPTKVSFILLDGDESAKLDKYLATLTGLKVTKNANSYTLSFDPLEVQNIKDYAVGQVIETIRNRLDQFGLAEPSVTKQGRYDIVVELPGIKNAEDEKKARELISRPANLEMMAIDEIRNDRAYTMSQAEAYEYGDLILPDASDENKLYVVTEIPILNGSQIVDARVAFDQQNNQPIISFTLDSEGARIFGDFTGSNIDKRLAVVLDGKVYSAPYIRERIGGGSGQISGNFTLDEASGVAIALKSGALPASVNLLEKRSIGPSLGADSIQSSLVALASGFFIIIIFMVSYYGYAGLIANVALIANIFILLAVMALFGATLTLPGMAGIVLTIGMAVDANVIITERIRELILEGKSMAKAIEDGYNNAMRAIIDANITTVLVAVVLYAYGTGAIKGFAVTISIGIMASMINAILGTHGIYEGLISKIMKDKNPKKWFGVDPNNISKSTQKGAKNATI
jgi:preprotein translocase subunit SecD